MDQLDFQEATQLLKSGEAKFYNFYNTDLDLASFYSIRHYLNKPNDSDLEQKLQITFTDIEVYQADLTVPFKFDESNHPVSAITWYSTTEKIYRASIFLIPHNFERFGITAELSSDQYKQVVENIQNRYVQQLLETKHIVHDEKIELHIFNNELDMLRFYWQDLGRQDPFIVSGYNCLEENQSVWLDNKIIKIKDTVVGQNISHHGQILGKKETGYKRKYTVNLNGGFNIDCSEEHIFPIFTKPKNKYQKTEKIIQSRYDLPLYKIEQLHIENDIYFGIRKRENTNPNLTFRELILNNLEVFLKYEYFNFIVKDNTIKDFIKRNHHLLFKAEDYWWRDNRSKITSRWNYKYLKDKLPIQLIKYFFEKHNEIYFLFKNKKQIKININDQIPNDVLQVLGLIYTDGFYSNYDENYVINNKRSDIINWYDKIINHHLRFKQEQFRQNTIKTHKQDIAFKYNSVEYSGYEIFKLNFSRSNILGLLHPLIYHESKQKNLNLELLSQLSYNQFQSFFSGLIDGDGVVNLNGYISLCNYEKHIQDNRKTLSEILFWNGIGNSFTKNSVYISNNQYSNTFIKTLNIQHCEKKKKLSLLKLRTIKNRISKKLRKFETSNHMFIRLDNIVKSDEMVNMYDIKTSDSLFISTSGIETHNSDLFDYPYLYRRTLKLFNGDVQATSQLISKLGFAEIKRNKFNCPDYTVCDLMYLFKPRGEGGLNFGDTLSSYSLDFVSDYVLGLKKYEYKTKEINLNEFYLNNPINYLLYNIVDVALNVRMNEKLKHIELHNAIRREMRCPFSQSMIGNSALFDSFVLHELSSKNQKVRHGMSSEKGMSIETDKLQNIPIPRGSKISPLQIQSKDYDKVVAKFDGAYVKQSFPRIINDKSLIIDLDASLPPWEKIFIHRNGKFYWCNIGDYQYQDEDRTLTWDENNNVCWKNVLGKVSHPWTKQHGKLLKITTETGKITTITDNHSVFGIKKKIKTTKINLLKASDLTVGDYVVGFSQFNPETSHKLHNPKLCKYGPKQVAIEVFSAVKGYTSALKQINGRGNCRYPYDKLVNLLPHIKNCYSETMGLEKITKIEEIEYEGEVYDISVKDTERFFSGTGIGVHNTSLYPSMMLQSNISFDVYQARVLAPTTYNILENLFEVYCGKKQIDLNDLTNMVHSLVEQYVKNNPDSSMGKEKQRKTFYYITIYLILTILNSQIPFEKIMHPTTDAEVCLMNFYLIPLLDIINTIHPKKQNHNQFVFDYIFDPNYQNKYKNVYIIKDINSPKQYIDKLNVQEAVTFIQQYSLTIVGTCFTKHNNGLGLFTHMLQDLATKRKSYQNKMEGFDENDPQYQFYNNRQLVVKVLMNSNYGISGLRSFRYSNHWIAQSITTQGRLSLKLAAHLAEEYLQNNYSNKGQ